MTHRVRITARALADIETALLWIQERSPAGAARWHANLLAAVDTLEDNPERCGLAPEADELGIELRQLLVGKRFNKYRLLFVAEGETVHVLHIRHSAKKPLQPGDVQKP